MGKLDLSLLKEFEEGLDTLHPEKSVIPLRILGYGEISTVFEILRDEFSGIAFKRLPLFRDIDEAKRYVDLYEKYNELLRSIGISTPEYGAEIVERDDGLIVLFLYQELLNPASICHKIIHKIPESESIRLFKDILSYMDKIWLYNMDMEGKHALGFDGQISNWAVTNYEGEDKLPEKPSLVYLDTTTPLIRVDGEEQLKAELFLKAAPPILRWILKKLFLQEILDRYYDFRSVVVDLIANLFKEKKPDLIPGMIDVANQFFVEKEIDDYKSITYEEVKKYYDSDASIWSIYLSARKMHRFIRTKLLRGYYEFILPEKIER